jgi:cell division septal protein FtsQ
VDDDVFRRELLTYAAVAPGSPLWSVNLQSVADRVLEHPFVSHAQVTRRPPDAIVIEVARRRTVAAATLPSGLYLVDEAGVPFKRARAGDGLDVPVLSSADLVGGASAGGSAAERGSRELAAAVQVLEAHARRGAPGGAASELLWDDAGFELVLVDATRVRLGRSHIEDKLARLSRLFDQLAAEGLAVDRVYLDDERRPERIAVRLRSSAETRAVGG